MSKPAQERAAYDSSQAKSAIATRKQEMLAMRSFMRLSLGASGASSGVTGRSGTLLRSTIATGSTRREAVRSSWSSALRASMEITFMTPQALNESSRKGWNKCQSGWYYEQQTLQDSLYGSE
jgi:hypothetical protein